MTEAAEVQQDRPCCSALKKKHSKLLEKYAVVEELKNNFRAATTLVNKKYDEVEKENESLKEELKNLKVQAERLKEEKDTESAVRVDLEDEVSALKEEIELLKQNRGGASQEGNLNAAEKEIGRLKEFLEKEKCKLELEKKNSEMVMKKADAAIKKAETGTRKASEEINQLKALLGEERGKVEFEKKNAEMERTKTAEALKKVEKASEEINRLKNILCNLQKKNAEMEKKEADRDSKTVEMRKAKVTEEINLLKGLLDKERERANFEKRNAEVERKKAADALKNLEVEKTKSKEAKTAASIERRKAEENKLLLEKLKMESDALKSRLALEVSKSKAVQKEVGEEKQRTVREMERTDIAMTKAEEQREFAEMNLKKAISEKERADGLIQKLEEERDKVDKLEKLCEHFCSTKLLEAHLGPSVASRNENATMMSIETTATLGIEKVLLQKELIIAKEKKRADAEIKKAKKQKKLAEAEKHRADQLSRELEGYKLRLEDLQKDLQEFEPYKMLPLRHNSILTESDTVKLLKRRLDLEKMLVKHAQKATEVEAVRNTMLRQEIFHLKQVSIRFQQHLDMLDDCCLHDAEGTFELEKVDNQNFASEKNCSNWYRPLVSGIDSELDPQYRGSNQKMLKSSAINSSSASFSDRPLVGSQERGTFSATMSPRPGEDKLNLKPSNPILSEKMELKNSESGFVKVGKSFKSSCKTSANNRRTEQCYKRRIVDAVESIENQYYEGHKLHERVSENLSLLHGILNSQKETSEPREEIMPQNSCRDSVRPFKRRKTSSDQAIILHPLQDSVEAKSTIELGTHDSDACAQASQPGPEIVKYDSCLMSAKNNIVRSTSQDFNEMFVDGYMKLLDLDNVADERSYRRAIASPLSPTLPDIEFHGNDVHEVDDLEMLLEKSSQEGLLDQRDNELRSSNFCATEMNNESTVVSSGLVFSNLGSKESVDFRTMDQLQTKDPHFHQIQVFGGKLGISDLSGSQNEGIGGVLESNIVSVPCHPKFLVVHSGNKGSDSIFRILQATNICMLQWSILQSPDVFLHSIIDGLEKAVNLSMEEKACIFLSLVLHRISEVGKVNFKDVIGHDLVLSLASLTSQILSAISNPALTMAFMESCDLFKLLALIEDFLLQRKVLVCSTALAESGVSGPKIDLILNGDSVILAEQAASSPLLVAGASVLASLCTALDQLDFVCEMSCNILAMLKFDTVLVLAVLHAFAHICGTKYFTIPQYTDSMTVVKSLVVFLEKRSLPSNSTSPIRPETLSMPWSCTDCPFSEDAVSMENVSLLLLEKLQGYAQSMSWSQDVLATLNSLVPKAWPHEETILKIPGLSRTASLDPVSNQSLCNFIDILSLIEIVASFMSWAWIFDHFISQLCGLLESGLTEGFSAAIITLLGQLGRLGIDDGGYEDIGVHKIREKLSAIVCPITFGKLTLSVQFAVITALCSLTSIKFEDILETEVYNRAVERQSVPSNFIRKWFSHLSDEQQSFFRHLQAANEIDCRIEFPSNKGS